LIYAIYGIILYINLHYVLNKNFNIVTKVVEISHTGNQLLTLKI